MDPVDLHVYAALMAGLYGGSLAYAQISAAPVAPRSVTVAAATRVRHQIASLWLLAVGGSAGAAGFGAWWLGTGDGWLAAATLDTATIPLVVYLNRLAANVRQSSSGGRSLSLAAIEARWSRWHGAATVVAVIAFTLELVLLPTSQLR